MQITFETRCGVRFSIKSFILLTFNTLDLNNLGMFENVLKPLRYVAEYYKSSDLDKLPVLIEMHIFFALNEAFQLCWPSKVLALLVVNIMFTLRS